MTSKPVPDDVRRFVVSGIPSVSYLEALLLFHKRSQQERTVQEVATALYIGERTAAELLRAMADAGTLAFDGRAYRYAPRDDALATAIDRLAAAYQEDLIGITNLIHDATGKSARRFADAFRLRKEG